MPSKSAEYKQKCIDDWEWMRDNCSDQWYGIYEAKTSLRRGKVSEVAPHIYSSCWACAYVGTLRETGRISIVALCSNYCPVTSWSEEDNNKVLYCLYKESVYAKIKQIENLQEHHFQSVIDVIKKNWIIEE